MEDYMIQIAFSDADIAALDYERYHHPSPQVQKRMEVLYLKSKGLAHHEIRRLCGISKSTLVTYLRIYQMGGIEHLKQRHYHGQSSDLNAYQETIESYFEQHPPRTTTEAQAVIERLTGIKRSPTQIRAFMKRIGLRVRKTGAIPGKATDPLKQAEQASFQTEQLEGRLEEARQGKRTLFLSMPHILSMAPFLAFCGVLLGSFFLHQLDVDDSMF
jgi:transposase